MRVIYKVYAHPWQRTLNRKKRSIYYRKLTIDRISVGHVYVVQKKNGFVYYGESNFAGKSKSTSVSTAYSGKRACDRFLRKSGILVVNNNRVLVLA